MKINITIDFSREKFESLFQKVAASLKNKLIILKALFLKYRQKKVFKIISIILTIKLSLLLTIYISSKLIDLNPYKDRIEKMILEETGQIVAIQGPLYLKVFPYPALEAKDIQLKDPAVKAKVIRIMPSMLSLFSSKKYFELILWDVEYKHYQLPEFCSSICYEPGVIEFQDTECELVKGKDKGKFEIDHFKIDTSGPEPKYYLRHQAENFPLAFLIKLAGGHEHAPLMAPEAHVTVELEAEGKQIKPIQKTLSGLIEVEIHKGRFHGADLIGSLKNAKSLVGTVTTKMTEPLIAALQKITHREKSILETTPFDKLKFSAKLKQGIMENHDLKISHSHYQVQGKGNVNLHKREVAFRVEAFYKGDKPSHSEHIKHGHSPLVIYVTGSLDKPHIKPDFDSYLKFVHSSEQSNHKTKKNKVGFRIPVLDNLRKNIKNKKH